MTESIRAVRHQARTLPRRDRADLAAELLASLDDWEPAPDVEAAWAVEIEQRARQALADPSAGEAWVSVRKRLRTRPSTE